MRKGKLGVGIIFPIIVFTLILARIPILQSIGSFLVFQDELKEVDVIIVLAGQDERVKEAVNLYKQGFSEHMIMTGRSYDGKINRAENMRAQAIRLGIPQEHIIIESEAQHTFEHPILVKPIMQARGFESAIVVSSPYHMRRVAMLFNRSFRHSAIELIYYPAQDSWINIEEWWKSDASQRAVGFEYMKMAVNIFGNWVSKFVGKQSRDTYPNPN
ncbi:MAG: YdcF family protein [Candidatus Omnitrophica bacterium]|nr:YdcF family protein [Candidatus Omnitrophota bacterium]